MRKCGPKRVNRCQFANGAETNETNETEVWVYMAKYLVIVESPTKVKTIRKFLGSNYEVMASNGHVRDLPKSQLGFDPENDYEPKYITIRGKGEILSALRKAAKKADKVFLATDPDREGEAISWHLTEALKLAGQPVYRITFNEITKDAVKEALKNPRKIDMDMVDAQQTRRMLDRMVGYRISPLLWAKIKRGLSAGRVQSVALRIVADREDEINAFIPKEYWTLQAQLGREGYKKPLTALFYGKDKRVEIENREQLDGILKEIEGADFVVRDVKVSPRTRKAPLPFTTSTLQQEAAKQLNFSTQKTMRIAQQLYEGVDIKGQGTVGLITYLRTDSTRVSAQADAAARAYIAKNYGEDHVSTHVQEEKGGRKIQDAHEAIRPSDINRSPAVVKEALSRDQFRLYQLIWKRFTASRMENAVYESTVVKLDANGWQFRINGSRLVFDGYLSVYSDEDDEEKTGSLTGEIVKGQEMTPEKIIPEQHFTQPPAHYTEASLVRTLEELGIGRPSTYAPTITTLLARRYLMKDQKNLYVTELGEAVNDIMKKSFPSIVDVSFTASLESLLDSVGEGSLDWKTVVRNFYPDLDEAVKEAEKNLDKIKIADEETDVVCEQCGRNMVIKYGPHGKFLACPGFPECRNTKPFLEKAGVSCPKCGKDVIIRRTKKGRRFYGCEDPECEFISWQKPSDKKCPKCGGYMIERGKHLQCADPECGYVE